MCLTVDRKVQLAPYDLSVQHYLRNISASRLFDIISEIIESEALWCIVNRNRKSALDPDFKVRKDARRFFRRGRVLRTLWTEPLGDNQQRTPTYSEHDHLSHAKQVDSQAILTANFGERVYSHIKYFAVIEEAENYCIALKIDTYGGKACNAPGVITEKHAIAYSGKKVPERLPGEERLLDTPIRVNPDDSKGLGPRSRINFGKVFTLEHNIKVASVGQVHLDSMSVVDSHFARFHPSWLSYDLASIDDFRQDSLDTGTQLQSLAVQPTVQPSIESRSLPIHKIICGPKGVAKAESEHELTGQSVMGCASMLW